MENASEFDYSTLIQYRSMHRIYALKYTEASQTFNQFSNMKKNPEIFRPFVLSGSANIISGVRAPKKREMQLVISSELTDTQHNNKVGCCRTGDSCFTTFTTR